jgi:hypothetical protein
MTMCDYSLQSVASRPAKVGDKLTTTNFATGTRGFSGVDDPLTAVCVLPGTELAFDAPVTRHCEGTVAATTAIFRQIDTQHLHQHHDALEFPDGSHVLLTYLREGQTATVLQLPAAPKNKAEKKEQTRVAITA